VLERRLWLIWVGSKDTALAYNLRPAKQPRLIERESGGKPEPEVVWPHYFNALEVRKVQRARSLHSRLLPPLGFEAASLFAGSVGDVDQG
jgi:hypothetical protein